MGLGELRFELKISLFFFSNTGTEALTGSLIHIHMPWLSSSTRVIFYDS